MTTINREAIEDNDSLEQAKINFVEDWESGFKPTIQQYVEKYPQFALELADFIMSFVVVEREAEQVIELPEPTSLSARALARAKALRRSTIATEKTLLEMVKASGIKMSEFVERMKLSNQAIQQIVRGQVSPVPLCLTQLLAHILQRSIEEMQSVISTPLARESRLAGQYRAIGDGDINLPEFKQRTFDEMLELCVDLSPERRELWKKLKESGSLTPEQKQLFGWIEKG